MANPKEIIKNENNPAAPDKGEGVPNAPNKRTVVEIQGNDINKAPQRAEPVLGAEGGDNVVAQTEPIVNGTPQGGTAGDNPKDTAPAGTGVSAAEQQQQDTSLDIDKLITESTGEIKAADTAQTERQKKQELLMRAINSRMYMENITYKNVESDEFVGTKMRYYEDPYGKSVYDYMNDPEVTAHIGFKVPKEDPKDGTPVNEQITIYWINPVF